MTQGMRGTARKPSPKQIAKYGHIAVVIRRELDRRKWSVPDLSQKLGLKRTSATAYHWALGLGAPTPEYRAKMAHLLGIPETDLIARPLDQEHLPVVAAPTHPTVVQVPTHPTVAMGKQVLRAAGLAGDVLGFSVGTDGMARLRLDVTLPLDQAAPLLRVLLDAGVVLGRVQNDGE